MGDRPSLLRLTGIGAGLAVAVVAGFLLGSCGGGDGGALATQTGLTGTRPALTATRPTVTEEPTVPTRTFVPTRTETTPATTAESPTETEDESTTTEPPVTITVETTVETETTVSLPIAPTTTTAAETTAAAAETSSTDDAPWGWIALAVALAAALVIGLVLWRRRRTRAASWSTQLSDLSRRSLVALDDVMTQGSVVTGQVQALAGEARSLETSAPDDPSRAAAARLRAGLDDLVGTLESDRTLRLGATPPSAEQISYSTALIHQQAEQLRRALQPPQ